MGQSVEKLHDRFAFRANQRQREAEQDGDQQHLQDVSLGERIHHGCRDDVHQEFRHALLLRGAGVIRHGFGIQRRGIHVEAGARMRHVADEHSGEQRQRGNDLKVQQRLAADSAHLLQVLHAGDSRDHRAKNNHRDHHGDQADKAIARAASS